MTTQKPLRLWPAVVIAIVQLLVMFGGPIVAPDAGLPVGMLGGVVGALVIVVWWLLFSRALWSERVGAIIVMIVTVAINRVEFKEAVMVGDVVRFETTVERIGRTSITMHINVVADRLGVPIRVTDAEVVYVGVDANRHPIPLLPAKTGGA